MAFRSMGPISKAVVIGTGALAVGAVITYRFVPFHVDFYKTIFDINETPRYLNEKIVGEFKKLQQQESSSLLKKHLTKSVFDQLGRVKSPRNATLHDIIQSGLENPDSKIGVYAPESASYDYFQQLFDPIIADIHGPVKRQPSSDWGRTNLNYFDKNLDPDRKYIKKTRIECFRNMAGMVFHPLMTMDDYYLLESKFKSGFLKKVSKDDDDLVGKYLSLTKLKSEDKVLLDEAKIVFKSDDKFLKSAKVYQHWPTGRAIFYNKHKDATLTGFIGGENHLKLVSEVPGGDVKLAFDRLGRCIKKLNAQMDFTHTLRLGYITYSPEILGSGVRATVEMKLPSSSDAKGFKEKCDKLNLKCHAGDGQGIYVVSNKQTLNLTEFESVKQLYDGVKKLIQMEEGGSGDEPKA